MSTSLPRFNGAVAWATFSLAEQAKIGAIALELVVASYVRARAGAQGDEVRIRACETAAAELLGRLDEYALQLDRSVFYDLPIPAVVGDICHACGGTELDRNDDCPSCSRMFGEVYAS